MEEPLITTSNSKGGLKTLPFIIANEAFEKAASYGVLPNMILYLMEGYGMELATGSNFIYFLNAASNLTPVIAAFLADSFVGRFSMISFGSIFNFLGLVLIWLTTIISGAKPCDTATSECTPSTPYQLILLVSAFTFMSIGAGGIRSSSLAFGADQLLKTENFSNAGLLERFFNWYYFGATIGVIFATSFVVYIQDHFGWKIGFGVPVLLMMLSALSFFLASPLFIKFKAKAGSLISVAQVLMASWKKRKLVTCERINEVYYKRKGSRLNMPSDKLRFLNKACVIENTEELTPDGFAIDPWRLCTINQVEELKALIKVIPIWSSGIILSVTTSQMSFSVLQAGSMDRHITSNFEVPAGSFGTFTLLSIVLWIPIYEHVIIPLASRITRKPIQLSVRIRMGIGLILSIISMAICAIIEGVRRETAIKEGFIDDPKGVISMSAYWLLFHHWFSGMSEAFFGIGQNEFFYSEFPKSMSSVATNLYGVGMCVASLISSGIMTSIDRITSNGGGESWVSSNINKAHFDYYYWLLAGLSFINFFYYLLCSRAYEPSTQEQDIFWANDEILDE